MLNPPQGCRDGKGMGLSDAEKRSWDAKNGHVFSPQRRLASTPGCCLPCTMIYMGFARYSDVKSAPGLPRRQGDGAPRRRKKVVER